MGVMEMSHRGKEFISIHEQAEADLRELLAVPSHFKILFMQGGGIGENAIVPLNLSRGEKADIVVTGSWSEKSYKEASKYCQIHLAATGADSQFTSVPATAQWHLSQDARYVHVCTNETIHGVEFHELPDLQALGCKAPLVIDFSSHVLSRSVDWSKVGLAFGGAQKNIGPAGLTFCIVRKDLLGRALDITPTIFNWTEQAEHDSMVNTPPTYSIYIAGLVFEWLIQQGGLVQIEKMNIAKANLLYEYFDSTQFYHSPVHKADRSRMNVPFWLQDEALNEKFLSGAQQRGLLQLKGHRSVGGMRASIYNAMPIEGVRTLVDYLKEFERSHG
jgi:phosphoserine aminotransferase